jgi:hypothetical protein
MNTDYKTYIKILLDGHSKSVDYDIDHNHFHLCNKSK